MWEFRVMTHRLQPNMLRVTNGDVALADQIIAEVEDSIWLAEHDAELLNGWANHFEHYGSMVGIPGKLTGTEIAQQLRGPQPFGVAAGNERGSSGS